MDIYKRILYLSIGLVITLIFSVIIAVIMNLDSIWLNNLNMPFISYTFHSICALFCYYFIAVILAEGLYKPQLHKALILIFLIMIFHIIAYTSFFRLHNPIMSLVFLSILVIFNTVVSIIYAKNTKCVFFIAILLCIYYIYLSNLNLQIILLNITKLFG